MTTIRMIGFILLWQQINTVSLAFQLSGHPGRNNIVTTTTRTTICKAKPTLQFDLDAIEKFEEELLKKENDDDEENNNNDVLVEEEEIETFEIDEEYHNQRLDTVLSKLCGLSRSVANDLIAENHVQISYKNKKKEIVNRKAFKVERGMILHVNKKNISSSNKDMPEEIVAQNLPLNILYEDEYMIVLNKANDMVVHPAVGHWDGTVVNALAYYLANDSPYGSGEFIHEQGGGILLDTDNKVVDEDGTIIDIEGTDGEVSTLSFRPGIVHRLDKGTTGVLIVAKTKKALAKLSESFKERNVSKTYMAITVGNPGKSVTINKPIGRHPQHRQRMRVVPDPHKKNSGGFAPKDRMVSGGRIIALPPGARNAISHVNSLVFDGKLSIVEVKIETGRKHQIRVHLQDRRTPVYGDDMYGLDVWNKRLKKVHSITRPLLHAYTLEIHHPITNELMKFRAPLPSDMEKIMTTIWPQGKEERPDLFT